MRTVALWSGIPTMRREAFILGVAAALGGLALALPNGVPSYLVGFALLWLLPGLAWTGFLGEAGFDRWERAVVGLGLGFVVSPLVTLVLSYLPGPVSELALVLAIVACSGLPLAARGAIRRRANSGTGAMPEVGRHGGVPQAGRLSSANALRSAWHSGWVLLALAVVIAAGLRLVDLGYSEFQGDEAAVVLRAAEAMEGDESAVFAHKKGPAELTTVMAAWRLGGFINEWMARLPFSWSSLVGVVAVFLLCRRLGWPKAGGIAACLLAINGYFVGFGRIVQYQSLVFALGSLGLLCAFVYSSSGRRGALAVAGLLFAGAILAHYDALLVLPAAALIIAARLRRESPGLLAALSAVGALLAVCAGVVAVFYVPFSASPYVGHTSSYLAGRIGGDGLFVNNLPQSLELSCLYNTPYLLIVMALAGGAELLATWARWGRGGIGVALCLALFGAATLVWPDWCAVGEVQLAWLPVAFLLAGAALAPGLRAGVRALWVWLAAPALLYLYLVAQPLTHVHTLFPAWAALCGIGAARLGSALAGRSRLAFAAVSVIAALVYVVSALYAVMAFVDYAPEYVRTYPAHKSSLYWMPYGEVPEEGLFGFPHRAGWKAVGCLIDTGQLSGSYDSNEEAEITDYYTRRALRLSCASPDFYFIAERVQDEVDVRWDEVEAEYDELAAVNVLGERRITVFSRNPGDAVDIHDAADCAAGFDRRTTADRLAKPAEVAPAEGVGDGYVASGAFLDSLARLLQYRVDASHAAPGGYVELSLVWEPLESTAVDYHVFTHLHDGSEMWGQLDGQPVCGNLPTSDWRSGRLVLDAYRIPIREDAPPGTIPLRIGMYDFATMARLPAFDSEGAQIGDSIPLGDVVIEAR
jgi:hypothetical protein